MLMSYIVLRLVYVDFTKSTLRTRPTAAELYVDVQPFLVHRFIIHVKPA